MTRYVLRWEYNVYENYKSCYTYGNINTLREKAKELSKDTRITYITIDEVKEVIKDSRYE